MSYNVVIKPCQNSRPRVWVNGEAGQRMKVTGVRAKYHFPKQNICLKMDDAGHGWGYNHAAKEADIWNNLEDEDRKHFLPILQWGELEGDSRYTYVITPYLSNIKQIVDRYEDLLPAYTKTFIKLNPLARKYNFRGDWDARQMVLDGRKPVIIDYGL